MATVTEENYLKALFHLSDANGEVTISDLSKFLRVSKPTVNSMVKNLESQKWITYQRYKPLKLTKKGQLKAAEVLRKHRLTEMFLVEKMGFSWDEVHDIAEQVEHIKAPEFFDRMDELMGFPKVDPHGSPIPDKAGNINLGETIALSDCAPGSHVTLKAIADSSRPFLQFLNERALKLNVVLKVKSISEFDHSVVVGYLDKEETLSPKVSQRLLVEIVR